MKRTSRELRIRRHRRIRKRIHGAPERPRLCVFRSNIHVYAQVIDDTVGRTLVSASTLDKDLRGNGQADQSKTEQAQAVGELIAQRALDAGITQVVFDRGGFKYHGRVKALAEGARKAGLTF
jgi:large subunit ribosomal protein L18